MKTWIGRFALLAVFALVGCGGGGGGDNPTFAVEGRVMNGVLVGSTVEVFGANGRSGLGTTTTDANGRFSTRVSQQGAYRLRAHGGKLNGDDYTGILEAYCSGGSVCLVTPYSTVLSRLVDEHGFNPGDAASHLANSLGFVADPFAGDVPVENFDLAAARQALAGGDGLADWVASVVAWAMDETKESPTGVRVPPPTDGTEPGPGDGTEPGPGDGTEPGPGDGTEPGPGDGTEPGPGDGTEPGPGDGTEPGPGDGTEPGPGDGTEPGPGDGTEPGPGDGTGVDPMAAKFDVEGLFSIPAAMNDENDIDATLTAAGNGRFDARRDVFNAIYNMMGSNRGLGAFPCYQGPGLYRVSESIVLDEGDMLEESGSSELLLTRSVEFVNCAVPVLPPNESQFSTLVLNGTLGVSYEDAYAWTDTSDQWQELVQFTANLRGTLDGRDNAFVVDGSVQREVESGCAWNAIGGSCAATENLHFPRLEAFWEPVAGQPNYFGHLNLSLAETFGQEWEWDEFSSTETDEFSLSGHVAASGMGGSLVFATPEPVRTVAETSSDGNGNGSACSESGVLEVGDAEFRFGEDTGVSGSAFQIVTGSGASLNFACGDAAIDDVFVTLEQVLEEPLIGSLLGTFGSGFPRW